MINLSVDNLISNTERTFCSLFAFFFTRRDLETYQTISTRMIY